MLANPLYADADNKCVSGTGEAVTTLQHSKNIGKQDCPEGKEAFEYIYRINRWRSEWSECADIQGKLQSYAPLDENKLVWVYATGKHIVCYKE